MHEFHKRTLEQLWSVVRSIPKGRVSSYGNVGRALRYPATGRMVGRWMAQAPNGVPWWRVVAKDGKLPIGHRGPALEKEQIERLRKEGIELHAGCVDMNAYEWIPEQYNEPE